jgi:hypothetical protein
LVFVDNHGIILAPQSKGSKTELIKYSEIKEAKVVI